MRSRRVCCPQLVLVCALVPALLTAQVPGRLGAIGLSATPWQLVRFEGGDGRVVTPDVRSKYTISFGTDGQLSARFDCNHGNGNWTSNGANQISFGPLALTRAQCPRGSLHDMLVRHWPYVRTYTTRNGHLFLSLQADAGTYEFEPMNNQGSNTIGPIHGWATSRERITLPRNAVFEAVLIDMASSNTQTQVIARVRNEQPGNFPIPFVIAFDPSRIARNRSYAVRASIYVDNALWFSSDQGASVLTSGRGNEVNLTLIRVSGTGTISPGSGSPLLESTTWKLISMPNSVVRTGTPEREANFVLRASDQTISGTGGCNSFSGSYNLNGDRISFTRVMSTMRACADPVANNTEQLFLRALSRTYRWRITGQGLDLLDSAESVVAHLEAVYR